MPVRGKNGGNAGQGSKWITKKRRLAIYLRDRWRCVWCAREVWSHLTADPGRTVLPDCLATLDHVIPREHGGNNTTPNLVTSCMRCNRLRGTQTVHEFALDLLYVRRLVGSVALVVARVLRAVLTPLAGPAPKPGPEELPSVQALEKLLAGNQRREVGGD
jgi:hypothetical protein